MRGRVSDLPDLQLINLSYNLFTGMIPGRYGALQKLQVRQIGVAGDAEEDAHDEEDNDVGEGETVFSGGIIAIVIDTNLIAEVEKNTTDSMVLQQRHLHDHTAETSISINDFSHRLQ
ncbi:hypothetical protein L2E82_33661 [Cichorium intybus]|uniref:Uncharacterized protein n=1 Tax=Cichorium intybus TaxID=13427 RepID=A0ACB9BKT0_CICIN|nr:hypothetical protein L2E82_33661 [Cichorium intybus]